MWCHQYDYEKPFKLHKHLCDWLISIVQFRSNLNILVSIKFMIEGSRPYMTELGHENYWLHRCVPPACHQRGGMRDESNNNISHDYYNDPGTIQHIWTHVHLLNENCRKQINLLNVLLLKIGHSGIWNS